MTSKRKQRSSSSDELLSLESLKSLNTLEFWRQSNAIELAEESIINIVRTSRNNKSILPILLPFVAAHVIKMSSSNRKGASFCAGSITEALQLLLEMDQKKSREEDSLAVERFLHTNIHYVQYFPAQLKKALLSVLIHKDLAPTPMVHKDFLIKWLQELLSMEGTSFSWALLGCLEALLKQGPTELSLVALLVDTVINGSSVINMLWQSLWEAVGSRPTIAGKKLALALCRYACMAAVDDDIVLSPMLLLGNQDTEMTTTATTTTDAEIPSSEGYTSTVTAVTMRACSQSDGGALFASMRKVINALLHEAGHFTISKERGSFPLLHGAPLLPLVLICHREQDPGIRTNALQLLVTSAPHVLARSGSDPVAVSASNDNNDEDVDERTALSRTEVLLQTPMTIWTAVASSIAVSLDGDSRKSNKTAQHKALTTLCTLLEKNPFTRKFQRNCTARQATALIHTELSAATQSSTAVDTASSIVFLREELSFITVLQNKIVPLVVRVVERAFLHGLATRDVALIETVLESRCLGLDATLVVATLERLPTGAMRDMLLSVVCKRCFHVSAITELAEAVLDDGSDSENSSNSSSNNNSNSNSNSGHFQKTAAYGSLMQLVGLMVQHGDTAAAAALTLAEELRALLIVPSDTNAVNNNKENRIEPILLSLSALLHQQTSASSSIAPLALTSSTTAHILSTKICRKFIQRHLTALVVAAKAKQMVNNDNSSRDIQHARLRIALWLKLVMEVTQNLPADDKERLQAAVFPDMLLEPTIMPIATVLALQLDAGKTTTSGSNRLLFESVAYLQDSALEPECEGGQAAIQYLNLLATVVTENARVVRARVKEQFKPSCGDTHHEATTAERHGGQEDTTTDQDCQEQDYMAVASATEELAVLTEQALEKSVGPGEFLSCFIPFLQHLVLALGPPVPQAIRIAALRALGTYMTISSTVLKGNIAGVEAMIIDVHAARANPNSSSNSSSSSNNNRDSCQPLHGLHSEAVVTWVSCFHPSTCDVSVLARGLVRALNDNNCDESTGMFVRVVLRCLHHLLVQNLVRNPAEIVATLALPLALNAPPTVKQISNDILDETFQRNAKLAAQALYQLCLVPLSEPSSTTASASSSSSSRPTHIHQSISRYLFDALTESQRFALVKAIVNAAKLIADNKDMEEGGDEGDGGTVGPSTSSKEEPLLNEVDRALTIDVLRSGSPFVMRALQLLDTTEESINAMRSAVELGTIRNLPSDVAQQIIQRLAAVNSNGRASGKKKSLVKGNRKKKPTNK